MAIKKKKSTTSKTGKKRGRPRKEVEPVDHFKIIEGIPTDYRKSKMSVSERKKYDSTLKLLVPNQRSTVLDKSEKNRILSHAKRNHPSMKMRSTKQDDKGTKFIVWREA